MWYSSWYFCDDSSFATLKSSSWRKGFRFAISELRAGGYWPVQYHEPGASHTRLAGSATHFLDLSETFITLKMRTLPYLEEKACVKRLLLSGGMPGSPWRTIL